MCGIFGIINGNKSRSVSFPITRLISQAFVAGSLRGFDSSGLMQGDKGKLYYHKEAVNGTVFSKSEAAQMYLRDADTAQFTICHNRAATQGEVVDTNAHPFMVSDKGHTIVGVHNGSLTGWATRKDAKDFSVDSEWALSRILEDGVDAFKYFFGPYCFVWYSTQSPGKIHIARNTQRPMYMLYVKKQDRLLLVSEWEMMYWLASRNDIDLEDEIIDVTPGKLYTIDVSNPRQFVSGDLPTWSNTTTSTTAGASPYIGTDFTDEDYEAWWNERGYDWRNDRRPAGDVAKEGAARYVDEFISVLRAKVPEPTTAKEAIDKAVNKARKNSSIISIDEARLARSSGDYAKEVIFFPQQYDGSTKELWGEISIESDKAPAVMRAVTAQQFDTYRRVTGGLMCRVSGALIPNTSDTVKELIYVVTKTIAGGDPESLSENLSQEIEKFMHERATSTTTQH